MATYQTQYPDNTSLRQEVWTLTLAEAKAVLDANLLDVRKGTYWENTFVRPYRRATRAKADTVRLYTAHFSTGELSNVLYNVGVTIAH